MFGDGSKADDDLVIAMAERGLKEAMVAPLQRADPRAGYLLVTDRAFRHEGFNGADLRFFEALAANAGVALRSSKLLEQLRQEAAVAPAPGPARHPDRPAQPALFAERLDEALNSPRPKAGWP